jgi:ammonia channel protein AmtB
MMDVYTYVKIKNIIINITMICIKLVCAVIIIIIIIILLPLTCNDGFRSSQEKKKIARELIVKGEPKYEMFRKKGLDGVEYYDAKQLWNSNSYSSNTIEGIL